MVVKLKDIARETGVSPATVSLALAGSPLVNEATALKVREAAERMGYVPDAAARSLVSRSSNALGLIVPDISNPYFGALAQQIEADARRHGCRLLIASSGDSHDMELDLIDEFIASRVKGVLIAPTNNGSAGAGFGRKLDKYGIRYLFVSSYYQGVQAPSVMVDLEKGSFELISYLLGLGHRDIFLLGADRAMIPTLARADGYRRAYAAHGLAVDESKIIDCRFTTFDRARAVTNELLDSHKHIDAIACINDFMALGALRALLDRGIPVPDDVSVAGYDDVVFASVSAIPITTVRQDISALGSLAVDTLFDMIGHGRHDRQYRIEPRLIVRRSTGKKTDRDKEATT